MSKTRNDGRHIADSTDSASLAYHDMLACTLTVYTAEAPAGSILAASFPMGYHVSLMSPRCRMESQSAGLGNLSSSGGPLTAINGAAGDGAPHPKWEWAATRVRQRRELCDQRAQTHDAIAVFWQKWAAPLAWGTAVLAALSALSVVASVGVPAMIFSILDRHRSGNGRGVPTVRGSEIASRCSDGLRTPCTQAWRCRGSGPR